MKRLILCIILLTVLTCRLYAQDSLDTKPSFSYGLYGSYGFIFAHTADVENTANSFPIGITASLNWQRTDRQITDQYNCFPRHSLLLGYYDFDNTILGKGLNVAYSIEPHFMLTQHLSFFPKASFGAALLSNPYDAETNPTNNSYSVPVSAYLSLGGGLRWQLSSFWGISFNAEYQHISNGGLRQPNKGINWPTIGFGAEFSPKKMELRKFSRNSESRVSFKKQRVDATLFGIMKGGSFNNNRKYYPIMGMSFVKSWQVSRLHAWTVGTEFYHDVFMRERFEREEIRVDGYRGGALVGHEFLLGKFIFSQQIGIYWLGRNNSDLLYHRWGLNYAFLSHWSVGINLRAHQQVADFTDVRLTYRLKQK